MVRVNNNKSARKQVTVVDGTFQENEARKISVLENGEETLSMVMTFHEGEYAYLRGEWEKITNDYTNLRLFQNKEEFLSYNVEQGFNGKKPNSLEGMMDVYARLSDDINEKRFNKKGKIIQSFLDLYIFNTPESQEVLNEYINNRNIENKKDSIQKKNEKYIDRLSKKVAKEKHKDMPELYADVSKCNIKDKVKLEHLRGKSASFVQEKENQKRLIFKKAFSR